MLHIDRNLEDKVIHDRDLEWLDQSDGSYNRIWSFSQFESHTVCIHDDRISLFRLL